MDDIVVQTMTHMIAREGRKDVVRAWTEGVIGQDNCLTVRSVIRTILRRMHEGRVGVDAPISEALASPSLLLYRKDMPMDADDAVVALGACLMTQGILSRVVLHQYNEKGWTAYLEVMNDETGQWMLVDATDPEGLILANNKKRIVVGPPVFDKK